MSEPGARVHARAVAFRARTGDTACGDRAVVLTEADSDLLCVADGTGHGEAAAAAAEAAIACVGRALGAPLAEIAANCHNVLGGTRGVALGLARVHRRDARMEYAGVGNTRAMVAGARTILLPNVPGVVGARCPPVVIHSIELAPGDLLVLATDAFPAAIDLPPYGRFHCDLETLVRGLIEEQAATRDDAAILAYRIAEA